MLFEILEEITIASNASSARAYLINTYLRIILKINFSTNLSTRTFGDRMSRIKLHKCKAEVLREEVKVRARVRA